MASLSALSAAIRDRLLAGEPAPLPGFGTLRRVHVPARVQARPDGSRTLRPPSENLRLVLGAEPDAGALAVALAQQMGLPVGDGTATLHQTVEQLEALLAVKGEVELEGVGILRRTDRGLLFGADPGLLATINAAYQGLSEVGTTAEADVPAAVEQQESAHASEGAEPPPAPTPPSTLGDSGSETDLPETASGDGLYEGVALDPFIIGTTDEPSALADSLREEVREDAPEADTEAPAAAPTEEPEALHGNSPPVGEANAETAPKPTGEATPSSPELDAGLGATPSPESADAEAASPELIEAPDPEAPSAELPVPPAPEPTDEAVETPPPPPADEATEADDDEEPVAGIRESEESDPVDALLAGIWTTGTPAKGDLGISAPIAGPEIEDADYDFVSEPPASPEPAEVATETASGSAPDAPPPAAHGRPAETPRAPNGLPIMPVGWTPSGDYDDEYEEFERPRRRVLPWVIASLVVLALIAAVLFGPRIAANVSSQDSEPAVADTAPSASVDAPEVETAAALESALDDDGDDSDALLDEAEGDAQLDPAIAAAVGTPSSAPGASADPAAGDPAPRRPTQTASAESGGRVESSPRAGGANAVPTVPANDPLSPDLSGLSATLARALAGDAPIRLDSDGFTWVVSSVSSRDEANAMVARYRRAGFRALVIRGAVGGQTMYRIAIGQFASRSDAYAVRDRLPADIRSREDIWTLNLADV